VWFEQKTVVYLTLLKCLITHSMYDTMIKQLSPAYSDLGLSCYL